MATDLGFGIDQFGTPYQSAADAARGANLQQWGVNQGGTGQPTTGYAYDNSNPFDYQALFDKSHPQWGGMKLGSGDSQFGWNGGAGSYGEYNPQVFDLVQKVKAFGVTDPHHYAEQLQQMVGDTGNNKNYNRAINYFDAGGGVGWQPATAADYGQSAGGTGAGTGTGQPPPGGAPGTGLDPNMTASSANFPMFNSPFINGGQSYADPGYQFRMDEGMRNLLSNKAAVGGLGSGQSLRDIMNYGQNAASGEYQNAYNRFTGDRNFGYGVASDDRNFAAQQAAADRTQANWEKQFGYNASSGDLDRNWQHQMALAQMGLAGAGGQGNINNILATLLSGNLNTQGQIGATGTMGGNNAFNGGLQQILAMLMQNQALNRYAPQAG